MNPSFLRSPTLHTEATGSAPDAFGPFRVLHQIGAGTLGPVFRGYDTERERLVAVKLFKLDSLPPERVHQLVASFERVIAADLSHPAIAEPIATGITGASAFLATDYVAADSLDHAVREFGPSPPTEALHAAASLAAALDQAAAVNIAHGCLHPRDVLLSSQETRLTGLGVAQALEQVGVPVPVRRPYTAPERITGSQWHRRADVFSLAALVHELLWGRRINAAGEQAGDALTPIEGADLVALKRAFSRALARDPADRFATATEFVDAIRTAMPAAAAGMAPPPSSTRRLRLAVNRGEQPELDPMAVLQQPRFADLDIEPDDVTAPRGPSILSFVDDREEEQRKEGSAEAAAEPLAPPPPNVVEEFSQAVVVEEPAHGGRDMEGEGVGADRSVGPAADPRARPYESRVVDEPPPPPSTPETPAAVQPALPQAAASVPVPGAVLAVSAPSNIQSADMHAAADSPELSILDRSRSAVWPLVLALMIGVVLGFAGGYAVGLRDHPAGVASTAAPGPAGKEFTESSVPDAAKASPSTRPSPQAPAPPPATPARSATSVPSTTPPRPEPRTARPQPEVVGRLLIRSTPAGARVIVDDRDAGRTPAAVRDLAIGAHRVRLVRDGYTTEDRRVVITRARPTLTMAVTLARVKPPVAAAPARPARLQNPPPAPVGRGALTVESRPPGARVFLDGRLVGTTPLSTADVAAGDHAIRLEHEGYRNWAASVRVTAGEQSRVTASLER